MEVTVFDMDEQPIRILQRPCTNASESVGGGNVPVIKTLEQKEAEYAAARDRIMGADYKPEISANDLKAQMRFSKESTSQAASQSVVTSSAITATPLMSIQATYNRATLNVPQAGALQRPSNSINNLQKPVNQVENPTRQLARMQQPSRGRVISGSTSSPSLYMFCRSRQQIVPLFPTQPRAAGNTGLLPTPGVSYAPPNLHANTGLSHSQSTALLLMHQFNLLQQQNYQQPINGIHSSFPPAAIHTPNIGHMSLTSVIPPPNGVVKQAHPPPTFN